MRASGVLAIGTGIGTELDEAATGAATVAGVGGVGDEGGACIKLSMQDVI